MGRNAGVRKEQSGVALLMALVLLTVFLMLGTTYMRYMTIEHDRVRLELRDLRTWHAARAGVYAAVGEFQAALDSGAVPTEFEVRFPVYVSMGEKGLVAHSALEGRAQVKVVDECAKINLNHVPPRVLAAILGVNLETARTVTRGLPRLRPGAPPEAQGQERRWLTSVDDMLARGFVRLGALRNVDRDFLTVYSVADQMNPAAFINVNSAPAPVMAAVLGVSMGVGEAVVEARPFTSPAELSIAAGKDPSTFNLRPSADTPDALPKALCFQSRCFRIVSIGTLEGQGSGGQARGTGAAQVEAVVRFAEDDRPVIMYWRESRGLGEPSLEPTA